MNDADLILRKVITRQVKAGEFTSASAARRALKPIVRLDKLEVADIPNILPLIVDGLKDRASRYRGADSRPGRRGQGDFASIATSFARLIYAPVALDEAPGTRRLPPVEMDLQEYRQHLALKMRKSVETKAAAEMGERFIETHPVWLDHPHWTMGELLDHLGIDDANVAAA
jgi:hypothetical protein